MTTATAFNGQILLGHSRNGNNDAVAAATTTIARNNFIKFICIYFFRFIFETKICAIIVPHTERPGVVLWHEQTDERTIWTKFHKYETGRRSRTTTQLRPNLSAICMRPFANDLRNNNNNDKITRKFRSLANFVFFFSIFILDSIFSFSSIRPSADRLQFIYWRALVEGKGPQNMLNNCIILSFDQQNR